MTPVSKSNPFYTVETPYYQISLFEDINYEKSGLVQVCAWRTSGPCKGRQHCRAWESRSRFPQDLSTPFATEQLATFVKNHQLY